MSNEFNMPAYPITRLYEGNEVAPIEVKVMGYPGLSIRQQAVLRMAAGFAANPATQPTRQEHFDNLATDAVRLADAVLKAERESRESP